MKANYYNITLKDGKLQTQLQIKDDISNFNDKRYMLDNLTSKPHEIYLQLYHIFIMFRTIIFIYNIV